MIAALSIAISHTKAAKCVGFRGKCGSKRRTHLPVCRPAGKPLTRTAWGERLSTSPCPPLSKQMKIESVDLFYLSMPTVTDAGDGSQDALLVRVHAGGFTGWGECEASPLTSIAAFVCPMSHGA